MTDDTNPPSTLDHAGPWDEVVNRLILLAPWLVVLGGAGYVGLTGGVNTAVTVSGTIPVLAFVYPAIALFAVTYALALMKFFGASPLAWVLSRAHNLAKNYNPNDTE